MGRILLSVPRYQEIVADLRRQIESGALAGGAQLPTFTELREQQGASQATVTRAYALLEREGLIVREHRRGIFVADRTSRPRTGIIGYIGGEFSQRHRYRYAAELVEGIEDVVHRENRQLLLLQSGSPVGKDKVDGVLISTTDPDGVARQLSLGVPAVSLLRPAIGLTSVVPDDYGGAKQGVNHLVEMGHCRIAALLQSSSGSVRLRAAGYQDAMQEAGIAIEPNWMREPLLQMEAGGYREWGQRSMREWLTNGWRELNCSALFAQNDLAALGAMEALQEAGYKVPEDISVLSFDGTDVCDFCRPRLTAVEVPLHLIASTATETLIQQIEGREAIAAMLVLPTRLKLGDSTAPPHNSLRR